MTSMPTWCFAGGCAVVDARRTQFGRSSEQLDAMIDQLQLSLEELQVSQTELTPPTEPPPRTVSRRKPLPEHPPREIQVHQPESQCPGWSRRMGPTRQLGNPQAPDQSVVREKDV
jgi:hypothetical protein